MGKRIDLDSRKMSKRYRMMPLNSFETQEMKGTGGKKAGDLRSFPILRIGIIDNGFGMEEMECKELEKFKTTKRSVPKERKCFSMESANLSGWVAAKEETLSGVTENLLEVRRFLGSG